MNAPGERVVPMRVQKFLARAGVASRRRSEDLMTAGRVTVNGEVVVSLGAKVDPARDEVAVDGRRVELSDGPTYFAFNKPSGVVTTLRDPHRRATVADFLPVEDVPGLFAVGRLDQDTTGLLLFTTDGELSHRLLHPRWKVPKTYDVVVDGELDEADVARLTTGVRLDDGMTAPAEVVVAERGRGRTRAAITIREGRKRQVRRMFSAVGHPVLELRRTRFGPIELGDLPEAEYRALSESEIAALRHATGSEA